MIARSSEVVRSRPCARKLGIRTIGAREVTELGEKNNFTFSGRHYVHLRRRLRKWEESWEDDAEPKQEWRWPFLFTTTTVATRPLRTLRNSTNIPWFLVDASVEARRREADDERAAHDNRRDLAIRIQGHVRKYLAKLVLERKRQDAKDHRALSNSSESDDDDPRSFNEAFLDMLEADWKRDDESHVKRRDAEVALVKLSNKAPEIEFVRVIEVAKEVGADCDRIDEAQTKLEDVRKLREGAVKTVSDLLKSRPLELPALVEALAGADDVGADVTEARMLIEAAESAKHTLRDVIEQPRPSRAAVERALVQLEEIGIVPSDEESAKAELAKRKSDEFEREELAFATEAKKRWGGTIGEQLIACADCHASLVALPENPAHREKVETALVELESADSVDAAVERLEGLGDGKWLHAKAYLAVANTSLSRVGLYGGDAKEYVDEYSASCTEIGMTLVPAALLAVARLCDNTDDGAEFRVACLRRCHHDDKARKLMTADELRTAKTPVGSKVKEPEKIAVTDLEATPEERWARMKSEASGPYPPSLDKLMAMVGLRSVKDQVLQLYTQKRREQALPEDRRVPHTVNFALLGNPGTGKTTVAELIGKLLREIKVHDRGEIRARFANRRPHATGPSVPVTRC